MLKITHTNAGFFSCCSKRLDNIVEFINKNKKLPDDVDSSEQFSLYKPENDKNRDITFDYFEHYDDKKNIEIHIPTRYHHNLQYRNYANLDYKGITQLIKKYFSPSKQINEIVNTIEKKYDIIYDNTLAVYYRGTDKGTETKITSFDDFYKKILEITNINKNIKILIQTDTAKFIDYINDKKLKNIVIINENKTTYADKGIHKEQSQDTNYNDIFNFFSTLIIMSRCKYIICGSSNCSIWMMFYRGHNKNVIQNISNRLYNYGWYSS